MIEQLSFLNELNLNDPAQELADKIADKFITFYRDNLKQYCLPEKKIEVEFDYWTHRPINEGKVLSVYIYFDYGFKTWPAWISESKYKDDLIKQIIEEKKLKSSIQKLKKNLDVHLSWVPGALLMYVSGIS
ncbi:MAG: hypothetical protein QXI16_02665 [Sulfolobaceae archaeon]